MRISIRVTPRAKKSAVEPTDTGYRVKVAAVPAEGKANAMALKLLAKHLKVAPSQLKIVKGAHSRDKLVELQN